MLTPICPAQNDPEIFLAHETMISGHTPTLDSATTDSFYHNNDYFFVRCIEVD